MMGIILLISQIFFSLCAVAFIIMVSVAVIFSFYPDKLKRKFRIAYYDTEDDGDKYMFSWGYERAWTAERAIKKAHLSTGWGMADETLYAVIPSTFSFKKPTSITHEESKALVGVLEFVNGKDIQHSESHIE